MHIELRHTKEHILKKIHNILMNSEITHHGTHLRFYGFNYANGTSVFLMTEDSGILIRLKMDRNACPEDLLYNQCLLDYADNNYPLENFITALRYIARMVQLSTFW